MEQSKTIVRLDRGLVFALFPDDALIEVSIETGSSTRRAKVLVVGLARTGIATALFCAERGARVTATEARPEAEIAEAAQKLRASGVHWNRWPPLGNFCGGRICCAEPRCTAR